MTINELEHENEVLREVLHDLENQSNVYRAWIEKNNVLISGELEQMAANEGC